MTSCWPYPDLVLPLPQTLTSRPLHRRQQILHNPALSRLSLHRHIHPRADRNTLAINQHILVVQRQGGRVEAATVTAPFVIGCIRRHRIRSHIAHRRWHRTVLDVAKVLQLHLGHLACVRKANVQIGNAHLGRGPHPIV